MVKRQRHKPFSEPSHVAEKYYERLSSENPTATSESVDKNTDLEATDSPKVDEGVPKPSKKNRKGRRTKDKNKILEFLKNPLTQILLTVFLAFGGMIWWGSDVSHSLNDISKDVGKIDERNSSYAADTRDSFQSLHLVINGMSEKLQHVIERINDLYQQQNLPKTSTELTR